MWRRREDLSNACLFVAFERVLDKIKPIIDKKQEHMIESIAPIQAEL